MLPPRSSQYTVAAAVVHRGNAREGVFQVWLDVVYAGFPFRLDHSEKDVVCGNWRRSSWIWSPETYAF